MFKYFNIMLVAFFLIITIILIKFKPIYEISIEGKELGYINNKKAFEEKIKESVIENKEKNVENINIKTNPKYELKLVDRKTETNEDKIITAVQQDVVVTYKYYEINLNNETIDAIDTLDDAEELINKIKDENKEKDIQLSIVSKYTENIDEVNTTDIEVAKNNIQTKVIQKIEEQEKKKQEEERIKNMPEINGVKLAYTPINGVISSRFGSSESVRNFRTHGGLDIAAPTGTKIKAVALGTVTQAGIQGGYGNLVSINHGNGVETYYGHCSKLLVKQGQIISAGDIIALVGSTGHSTGPHLHLEIRVNGKSINPQNYLY